MNIKEMIIISWPNRHIHKLQQQKIKGIDRQNIKIRWDEQTTTRPPSI